MKAILNLDAWNLLLILSKGGGLKRSSVISGLDLPTCTRLIQKLESELGFVLLDRTVRPVQLTPDAMAILPHVKKMLTQHEGLLGVVNQINSHSMTVRLSVPVNVIRSQINEHIRSYAELAPSLQIQVLSDMDHRDVLDGRVDLAYLPYIPTESGLTILRTGSVINVPLVSKAYLKNHPLPYSPEDLINHTIILRKSRFYPQTTALFKGDLSAPCLGRSHSYAVDVQSGKEAVLNGEGVAIDLSLSICRKEIEDGLLIPVLNGWHRPPWEMCVAVSAERSGNKRLMHFAEWFANAERIGLQERRRSCCRMLRQRYPDYNGLTELSC